MQRSLIALLFAAGATALAPSHAKVCARREALAKAGAALTAAVAMPAFADGAPVAAPEAPVEVVFPTDWGIAGDYYTDAAKVVTHMRLATS